MKFEPCFRSKLLQHSGATAMLCVSPPGCSQPLSTDEAAAREEILAVAPIGSKAEPAKSGLEEFGFRCSWKTQEGFAGRKGWDSSHRIVNPMHNKRL